jgi:endonuclease/exonuclease/phosphatase (EEP) superfamily protein YafD
VLLERALRGLVILTIAGTGLASLLGRFGAWAWWLDLFAHFRVQYFLALVFALVLAAVVRRRRLLVIAGALLVLELATICAVAGLRDRSSAGPSLRLVHFNLLSSNHRHAEVQRWISDSGADLVFVQEVIPRWADVLAATPGHAVIEVVDRDDNFGLAILARSDSGVEVLSHERVVFAGLPALAVRLRHEGRVLAVLSLHTLPPMSAAHTATRDTQLIAAAQWAAAQKAAGAAAVVLGDFNATPFSSGVAPLAAAGLRDSLDVRSLLFAGSWPGLSWPLRIAIDHCWHDERLVTVERAIGPALGSDHRPLTVTLAWAR